MATLTERGLQIDNLPELLNKARTRIRSSFADIVPIGQTLDLDDSSVIMRLTAPLLELILNQDEALQQVYQNLDLDQATGIYLDKLVGFGGLFRLQPTPAEALLMLYGEIGTTVATAANVGSSVTNDVFRTQDAVTFSTTAANGVEYEFPSIGSAHVVEFIWAITNDPNTNVPVYVNITAGMTQLQAATAVAQAINITTVQLLASVTNDNLLKVVVVDQNDTATFTATNMDAVNSYMPVRGVMIVSGQTRNDRNTLTVIQTGTLGWLGVTNPFDATEGTFVETDAQLRDRFRKVKGLENDGSLAAMVNAITAISGVRYINIKQNKLNVDAGGIPAHGIGVVVLGGDEDAIAQAIFANLPLGINTGGDETRFPLDINGNPNEIKFSRPSFVPIKVNMTLTIDSTFPDNGAAQIRQAIVDFFSGLQVGDDILYSRLFSPINTVRGFSVNTLSIGKVGGSFDTSNITIAFNELATISESDITFGTA
jgi:uncharacterized phage protein gp47/JayE